MLRGLKSFDKFTERIQLYMCRAFRYQRFVKSLLRLMTKIHNGTVTAFIQIHAAEAVFNTVKYRYEKNVDKRGIVNGLQPLMHVNASFFEELPIHFPFLAVKMNMVLLACLAPLPLFCFSYIGINSIEFVFCIPNFEIIENNL